MNGEGRIPPLLIAGLVLLVLAVGALAYYAGRFGRPGERPPEGAAVELPPPGPPDPAVARAVPTPAEVPPTVTPSVAVLIEKETRTERTTRSTAPLMERSSQIEVPVPAVIPTAPIPAVPTPPPTPRREIVVEIVSTPVPTPEQEEVEPEEVPEDEVEPPPDTTPEPEPEPTPELTRAGVRLRAGLSGEGWRSPSGRGPRTRSRP